MQAPGGPDEDRTGGFSPGGWMFGYRDENMDISASGFDGKERQLALRLVRSQVSTTGALMSTYVPGGDIQPDSFSSSEPTEKELARREKMTNGMWRCEEDSAR